MTKRTRFTALLDQGYTRSEAAQRVKVRSRSTSKRWHDQHLTQNQSEFDRQFAGLPSDLKAAWANHPALQGMLRLIKPGESLEQELIAVRDWKAPEPPPPPQTPLPIEKPASPAPVLVDWTRVKPDFGPDPRTEHRQRTATAVEAAMGDPFSRHLTAEDQAGADFIWKQWQADRIDAVRQGIREEQRQAQLERNRHAEQLSLPRWRKR